MNCIAHESHTQSHFLSVCGFCHFSELAPSAVTPEWVQPNGLHGGSSIPHQSWCTGHRRLRSLHQGIWPCVFAQAYLQSQPRPFSSQVCAWGLDSRGFLRRWGRWRKLEDAFPLSLPLSGLSTFPLLALCCPFHRQEPTHLQESSAQSSLDSELNPSLCWPTCLTRSCAGSGGPGNRASYHVFPDSASSLCYCSQWLLLFGFVALIAYLNTWECSSLLLSCVPHQVIYVSFKGLKKSFQVCHHSFEFPVSGRGIREAQAVACTMLSAGPQNTNSQCAYYIYIYTYIHTHTRTCLHTNI